MGIAGFIPCFLIVAQSCSAQITQHNIVLINTGALDRKGIAEEINVINSFSPAVLAIDVQFYGHENYSYDHLLLLALEKCKNLVMISIIANYTGVDVEYNRFTYGSMPEFLIFAKTGFANTTIEKDKRQALKRFSIREKVNGNFEYHFSVRTAIAFDSLKVMRFVSSNPRLIDIDYKDGRRRFKTFSPTDVLGKKISREDIEGKIVMLGFMGPGDEDKFFTPLNRKTKPYKPDMYGVECLANIVAQVLEN